MTLALPNWVPHRAGQHYDVRLTATDGNRTERSYSAAAEPERVGEIDLTVERIDDGEVSPYLDDVLVPGDKLEVRGPVGGYFVWDVSLGGPLLLIGGGSGVVPLMATHTLGGGGVERAPCSRAAGRTRVYRAIRPDWRVT
ncbi:MAG TPA: FAD-binding oxidoreductase [Candidatus Limnocylindria bacterium]|nr:FAD-binding oxidoreductase [Candidatus Limnocylindria bacterium]